MKYIIVTDGDEARFVHSVNELIQAGWVLHGGVAHSMTDDFDHYAQAMIKHDDSEGVSGE